MCDIFGLNVMCQWRAESSSWRNTIKSNVCNQQTKNWKLYISDYNGLQAASLYKAC